jgi:predicted lipoprotein
MTADASVSEAQSIRETPVAAGAETAAAGTRMDPDEMVEKIWQKIMRKLTIEQERRGYTPWG